MPAVELPAGELHVWTLLLDAPAETRARLAELLPVQERERFERILTPAARAQRLVARAGLRLLLGRYLRIGPREVELVDGARGRPELDGPRGLSFNLSHTADLAVFAIARRVAVGVDIEALDRRAPTRGLIERTLNTRERERVMRAGADRRTAAFLEYWTVKEAYVKALGVGLALDLRQVGVERCADRPRLDLPGGPGEWRVRRLRPRPGIVGAVVADGAPWRMRLRALSLR
jgi:4'-phosphopantetheinyl transferase